eukprot:scaffold1917_cov131-Skeletonema_marinoi.AAC.2
MVSTDNDDGTSIHQIIPKGRNKRCCKYSRALITTTPPPPAQHHLHDTTSTTIPLRNESCLPCRNLLGVCSNYAAIVFPKISSIDESRIYHLPQQVT